MSLFALVHHLAAFIAIGVVAVCLVKRHLPHTLYFTGFAICVCVLCVGHLFESMSSSLAGGVTALKIQYFGIPFLGPFFLLFGRDYSGRYTRKRYVAALLAPPAFITIIVSNWPLQHWYYRDLLFVTDGAVSHVSVVPGPLYYPAVLYFVATTFVGTAYIAGHLVRTGRKKRYLAAFLAMTAVPLASVVLRFFILGTTGYDPIPLSLVAHTLFMAFFLLRLNTSDWLPLGRTQAVEKMRDAYVLADTGGHFMDANAAAVRYLPGLARLEKGAHLDRVDGLPDIFHNCQEGTHAFTMQNGAETLYLRASCTMLTSAGRVVGHCYIIYDDTENHLLMTELHAMATHDALTNLLNRGTFFLYAMRDFDLCRRKREPSSLLMLDVDLFKDVNDVHGHLRGDRVLMTISETIRTRLRHTDLCGRYGGEEIVVWLPGATAEGAGMIADIVRRAIESLQFESEKGPFGVTVSIGLACVDFERHDCFDALVNDADAALYRAKNGGRNQVCAFAPPKE